MTRLESDEEVRLKPCGKDGSSKDVAKVSRWSA